jgi:protein KRI1
LRQVALEAQLNPSRSPSPEPFTHIQEQAALRKETISAFNNAAGGDGDDDLLVLREKTNDEQEQEEAQYRAFLEREVGDLKDIIGVDEDYTKMSDEQSNGGTESHGKKRDKKKDGELNSAETLTKKKRKLKEEEDQEFLMKYVVLIFFA